jgi:hypothetical protein
MPKAVAHLGQIVKALDAYADKTVTVTPVVADGRKS